MYAVTRSIEGIFKGSNNRTVPDAYANHASNGLLERLIQSIEKTRNKKWVFERHNGAQKLGISGYFPYVINVFHHYEPFVLR